MAGGTWLSQNKVRPGAYINFKSVAKSSMTVGDRGIVAMPLSLHWGKEGELIPVLSSEMLDGASKKLVGFDAFDSECKLLAGALKYCYKALVYRTNTGGVKATGTAGDTTITAKCTGTFGNKIVVVIELDTTTSLYTFTTYVDSIMKDKQIVSVFSELESNDWVDFANPTGTITVSAGVALAGGTDGTEQSETVYYPLMFALLKVAKYQVLASFSTEATVKAIVQAFIKSERDDEGRYVQAVVNNYDGANHEGVINSISGCVIDGVTFSASEFVSIVAGMTAGANVNESNTAKEIDGATSIVGELTSQQIKDALEKGKFLLSSSTSGKIKVEQDIDSLHIFTKEKNKAFAKNRVMRTLDEIGTSTKQVWEDTYMGKVDNNDDGRNMFKSDLSGYGDELQRLKAIQNFDGTSDITVTNGEDVDAVLCEWEVQPVDSMEKLYMTVKVNA